jgi:hypothetical protein
MLANDLDRFEHNARKLMSEAMNLSMQYLESAGFPHSEGTVSYLTHQAAVSFVAATKVLISVFRLALKKT